MKSLFEEKEAVAGAAPIGGSTGAGSPQGAKSPHSQAHSEGCDSGKGVARGAHDGTSVLEDYLMQKLPQHD